MIELSKKLNKIPFTTLMILFSTIFLLAVLFQTFLSSPPFTSTLEVERVQRTNGYIIIHYNRNVITSTTFSAEVGRTLVCDGHIYDTPAVIREFEEFEGILYYTLIVPDVIKNGESCQLKILLSWIPTLSLMPHVAHLPPAKFIMNSDPIRLIK